MKVDMYNKMSNTQEDEEGFLAGGRIAKLSFITLAALGVAEVVIGLITNSIVTFADGIDSFGDAAISLIVWLGLLIAKRKPDSRFGFGYYKVESFAALLAAVGMVVMGSFITYQAIQNLLHPHDIEHPEIAVIVLSIAASISGYRAYQMHKIAKRYNLLSLSTDAKNSIKDSSASVIGLISIIIFMQTGFIQMDAIGALAIAAFIFSVSYVAIKESSLILLDAVKNPKLIEELKNFIEKRYRLNVLNILLRPLGPYLHGEVQVLVEGDMTIDEFDDIAEDIEKGVKKVFPRIKKLVVTAEPREYYEQ
ncbi:MAG: hypothetical protein KatS3mg003_2295 [Candidatus Nitrosocaldaceae archaeon]|nr:MAG: hypothetical protein KatS3mg003_2295 [Candidatus Nitrosocaldaceae archaeon]